MNAVAEVAGSFFKNIWTLFLETNVPGLDVSFAAFVIAIFLISFSIRLFGFITGFSGLSAGDYGRAADAGERAKNEHQWSNRRKIGF